jgi:hypothetical protein
MLLLLLVTCIVWGSIALVGASDGAMSMLDYLLYVYGGIIFGAVTLVTVSVLLFRRVRRRHRVRAPVRRLLVIQTVFLLGVHVGVSFDLAFAARFRMSRAALTRAATEIQSGRRTLRLGWIGFFNVREVDTVGRAVRFVTGTCMLDDCGLAFGPDAQPPAVGEDRYARLAGPWWYWHRSF